ncbi:MAG: holo-ACP synthase [Leptospiraceae bacterium]|nr:holo-ACP synthase [Leptospiraceae bacterium]MDW7976625.1 holo-ACP synthase [Leptospiraceae bacterium]
MIIGIGVDIVEHHQIRRIYEKYKDKFLERYFNTGEIEYSLSKRDPIPHISARFAVKEATIKALNIKDRIGLYYKEIEIAGKNFGKKELKLKGKILEIANEKNIKKYHFSLTHSDQYSIGIVIFEG